MTPTPRTRTANGGFLLTETLATFTISAFVLLGLVSAVSVLLRAVDVSLARIETVDDIGRAMEAIRRDVAGLSRSRWNGREPQPFVFRGGPNALFFAQRPSGAAGAREVVALREIVTPDGPTLVRSTARLPARAASFDDLVFGPQRPLWTGAARLRFAYVPRREAGAEPAPRPDWPIATKLPEAILVEAIDRTTRRVIVSARVAIEADADIGCIGDSDAQPGQSATTAAATPAPGSGGVSFSDLPPTEQLPAPIPAPDAQPGAAAAGDEAFCSRAQDAEVAAKPPATPTSANP